MSGMGDFVREKKDLSHWKRAIKTAGTPKITDDIAMTGDAFDTLYPKPELPEEEEETPVMPVHDDPERNQRRRQSMARRRRSSGRESTILSGGETLG